MLNRSLKYQSCTKGHLLIPTDAETVCGFCGWVVSEKAMGIESPKISVIPFDENRVGSMVLAGPGSKYLQRFKYREKLDRKKFNDACVAIGLSHYTTRTTLCYFDALYSICNKMIKNGKMNTTILEILKKTSNIMQVIATINCTLHLTDGTARKWLEGKLDTDKLFTNPEPSEFKVEKPKNLGTINIVYFSAFYTTFQSKHSVSEDVVMEKIKDHMGFKRQIKKTLAMVACTFVLSTHKKINIKLDSMSNDLTLATKGLCEKAKRYVYQRFVTLSKETQKKKMLLAISNDIEQMDQEAECL